MIPVIYNITMFGYQEPPEGRKENDSSARKSDTGMDIWKFEFLKILKSSKVETLEKSPFAIKNLSVQAPF